MVAATNSSPGSYSKGKISVRAAWTSKCMQSFASAQAYSWSLSISCTVLASLVVHLAFFSRRCVSKQKPSPEHAPDFVGYAEWPVGVRERMQMTGSPIWVHSLATRKARLPRQSLS